MFFIRIMFFFTGLFLITPAFANVPSQIKQTNIASGQFAISWITDTPGTAAISYGQGTNSINLLAVDNRLSTTHHVEIKTGLSPNTTYYYDIISGGIKYDNNGKHYSIATGPDIGIPTGTDTVYGQVYKADWTIAQGSLVYLKICDTDGKDSPGTSSEWSVVVESDGYWSIPLANVRTGDQGAFFKYSISGDSLSIFVQGGADGTGRLITDTANDYPCQYIRISTDTIAPAAITNLSLGAIGQTSAVLKWSSPGDDGNTGTATNYQVRYSINPITESNWLNVSIASGVPVPKSAGTNQQCSVSNLMSGTPYYFAIKACDEVPNWSGISNIATATTLVPSKATLEWLHTPNFAGDGLRTEIGTSGMNIVYQVRYKDADGNPPALGYPRVGIYREGISMGTSTMLFASGSFSTGAVYSFSKQFTQSGTYTYQLDGGNAIGTASDAHLCMKNGPIILESFPDHQVTNITDTSFTVSWSTLQSGLAQVVYGTQSSNLNATATDASVDDIHQVTVDGLREQITYYYDNGNGISGNIETGIDIIPEKSDLAYGKVFKQGGTLSASGAVVYAILRDGDNSQTLGVSAIGSTRVKEDGWSMDLVNLRDISLSQLFKYSPSGDYLHLWVNGAIDGVASQILMTDEDTPAYDLELCNDHIPPATVTNIAIQSSTRNSITLKWDASGDYGNIGKASCYHIRYATSTDRVVDWGLSAPLATNTSVTITGLNAATAYYFIVQASDDVWNTAAPSQIVMGTTAPPLQRPPVLSMVSKPLTPRTANVWTRFTYNVKYTDADGDLPTSGEPMVIIYKDNKVIKTCPMTYVVGACTTGATYTCSTLLPEVGTYSYSFEVTGATNSPAGNGPLVFDIPKHLRITNVTNRGFTVSWRSGTVGTGSVSYGTQAALGSTTTDNASRDVHYVTVENLEPDTVYYFNVACAGRTDDNQGRHYLIKTGASIFNTSPGSDFVTGYVYEYRKIPAQGAVVYVTIKDADGQGLTGESAPLSVLTDAGGGWFVDLLNARTRDYLTQFEYSNNDIIYIEADGGNRGQGNRLLDIEDSERIPDIILRTWIGARDKLLVKDMTYSYPNPAKQTNAITFRYYLNADADVTLRIYNLAGELIQTIKGNGIGYNDTNELVWDINDIASDIYIWQLEVVAGELQDVVVKRLAIVK
ncbi:fibronectin type III domain-containing protein [Candidatus Desantisbacteria bacterium]|nr:fibronectin type III domain-containing protein [Candidatus Desantisbacteria bacterium]